MSVENNYSRDRMGVIAAEKQAQKKEDKPSVREKGRDKLTRESNESARRELERFASSNPKEFAAWDGQELF